MPPADSSDQPVVKVLLAALCLAVATVWSQTPQPDKDQADDEKRLPFRSLEVHERQQALVDIQKRLIVERTARRNEARALAELSGIAQGLAAESSDDSKIQQGKRLQPGILTAEETLRGSRLRRLEILDRIQEQASAGGLSRDGGKLLQEADREVRIMLGQQQVEARKLAAMKTRLSTFMAAVPPPPAFENASGITMRLVGRGPGAFYVSARPVPAAICRKVWQRQGGAESGTARDRGGPASDEPNAAATAITWGEAQGISRWLSRQEGRAYRLPSAGETTSLAAAGFTPETATWLRDVWEPEDYPERRDMKRFAVYMAGVWDPTHVLSEHSECFGEFPFARYQQLGMYVTTDRRTGLENRWKRLEATGQ